MFPILHFEWNESAASLSEIIRPFGNLVKNRQQYIIQYSNSNKTLSSNAVIETTVHPTGYELFYDGTLLLKRVRMNIKTKRNDQEFIYEMIYISKGFKVVFNISINSDQMLFTFSKGVEHYRIFAAKIVKYLKVYFRIHLHNKLIYFLGREMELWISLSPFFRRYY